MCVQCIELLRMHQAVLADTLASYKPQEIVPCELIRHGALQSLEQRGQSFQEDLQKKADFIAELKCQLAQSQKAVRVRATHSNSSRVVAVSRRQTGVTRSMQWSTIPPLPEF